MSIEEKYDEVKQLIAIGKEKGYLLYDEVNELLPADITSSDELDDLRICDRVLVMFRGRVTAELDRGWHDHTLVAAMEGVEVDV